MRIQEKLEFMELRMPGAVRAGEMTCLARARFTPHTCCHPSERVSKRHCSVETLLAGINSCKQHRVVGQHTEETLAFARFVRSAAESCTKQTLVSRDGAFDLPALAVFAVVKAPLHLPTVLGPWPPAAQVPSVYRDHRRANAQVFSAETMIFFAVEGGIAQHAVPSDSMGRCSHGGAKLGPIIARSVDDRRGREEMARRMANDCQFRPQTGRVRFAQASNKVTRGVPAIQTRGA